MNIEYKKIVKVDELAFLIPFKAGATFSQLWQIFYYTRLFKYISYKQYVKIKPAFAKICTFKNLQTLCTLGYLKSLQPEVYSATDKVLPILREAGYLIHTLPLEPAGKGDINELSNTDAFIEVIKWPYFYTLLYPQFGKPKPYLIPDTLVVQLDKANRRYKLTFLEIERKKPNWKEYLENKEANYLRLSSSVEFYDTWKGYCEKLDFPKPDINKLKFTYQIIKNKNAFNT